MVKKLVERSANSLIKGDGLASLAEEARREAFNENWSDELEREDEKCADKLDAKCEDSERTNEPVADVGGLAAAESKGTLVELKNRLSSSSLALAVSVDAFQWLVSSSSVELNALGLSR